MKQLFKYLNIAMLFVALSAMFTSCMDRENFGFGDEGLGIKVFSPTIVTPGLPMTINGSGFNDVTEIVFPGDIIVKKPDFEVVTGEMIRVKAPQGLTQEGTILVRNSKGETAESRLPLTIGHTTVLSYSAQEGDEINGNDLLTAYGKDMQFITRAEFIDEDGNPIYVEAEEFHRVAPGRVVVQVPAKVKTDLFPMKLYAMDGQVFESPAYNFKTATGGGHWEYVRRYLWENDKTDVTSWGGLYRLANEQTVSGEECFAFSMDNWAIVKEGEVFFEYKPVAGANANVRITTGWWSAAYGGGEHNCAEEATVDETTGNMVISMNIKADGNLYDVIDQQHLLFTGDNYVPVGIYVIDAIWIEGGGGHFETVRKSFWKNGEQSTIPAPSWSGEGRFCSASRSSGEETYAFSDEDWEILKTQPFRIAIEKYADWVNLRVTTGWWSTNYMGLESLNDLIEQDENGKYFVEINLASDPALLAVIDEQHLLFTGEGYKLLEIYTEEEVWVEDDGGAATTETVMWTNEGAGGEINWDGKYRFCIDGHDYNNECIAGIAQEHWDVIKTGKFYLTAKGSDWVQMRITTGWWSTTWTGADITTGDERIVDNGDGTFTIEINFAGDPILDLLDEQHLLFTGGGYTPLKLYYKK